MSTSREKVSFRGAPPVVPESGALELGFVVPGWTVRAAFGVVAGGLCLAEATSDFWLSVALLLAAAAVAMPRWLTAWYLIGVLSFTVLLHGQSVVDWRPYVLIAGAHALHILGSWMLVVPPAARLQAVALWPSARRFALIQVPVQAATVGALALAHATSNAPVIGLAAVAGLGVLVFAVLLTAPLRRRPEA